MDVPGPTRVDTGTAGRLQFVVISNPAETKTPEARKIVRSQAARESQTRGKKRPRKPRPLVTIPGSYRNPPTPSSTSKLSATAEKPDEKNEYEEHFRRSLSLSMGRRANGPCIPEPTSWLTAAKLQPFDCFARRVSPFEQYLIDYYVTVSLPSSQNRCRHKLDIIDRGAFLRSVVVDWISFSLTEAGVLCGLLLIACRRLTLLYDNELRAKYEQLALHYKGEVIRSASEAIVEKGTKISDLTIAKVLTLAMDDSTVGNVSALVKHVKAVLYMVELRGGRDKLGLNGFLARAVEAFIEPDQPILPTDTLIEVDNVTGQSLK